LRRAPGLLLLAALALAGCGGDGVERPAGAEQWDVVVLLLDALPASALGCYGYERDVSPRIDAFAAGALRFEQAWAPASYTMASVASIFTGLPPATHGVVGLDSNVLRDELDCLAEALATGGMETAGFSCNPHITPEAGFGQGFEHFAHYDRDRFDVHAAPAPLLDDVERWWRERADRRRFLYVHLLPPHQPYDPPPPHGALFGADATDREEGMTDFLVELDDRREIVAGGPLATRIRARYDAGVHYADALAGELLDRLGADGGLERAAVVLLSDHGEAFGEHGRLLHGSTVFEEMTRVPLLVRLPGDAARAAVEPGVARTRDLAATLCALVGASWPAAELHGRSFLPRLLGTADDARPRAISRSVGNQPAWAIRDDRWTYVEHRASRTRLLFDRDEDPGELRNLAGADTKEVLWELAEALDRELAAARRAAPEGPREAVTTHLKAVRDLGYGGEDE